MKIVIIGLGAIGKSVLRSLSNNGHAITLIDENSETIERLIEKYDVYGVVGNGACMEIQAEANVGSADLVIALTRNDELNIFACLVAKQLGVKNTIARVRNPDYRKQIAVMKDSLGISMIINPELEMSNEIFNMINLPSAIRLERFAKGRALLVEVIAEKGCALIGESLLSLGKKMKSRFLICAVQRGNEVFIPSGTFVIEQGDKIYFTSATRNLVDFLAEAKLVKQPFKNIMIVGGGRIGYYLADALLEKKYSVKLIEKNVVRANELADALPKATIILGNGTQHDLLLEEGIESMDVFVALTEIDEENMIVSMFANKKGVHKTIAQIKYDELHDILSELDIGNAISPQEIVTSRIISYVRALDNSRGSNILNLYQLVNCQVEALEFAAKKHSRIFDTPLKELKIKKNCLIACIIRNGEVIIPNGNAVIKLGDNVVVVTTRKNFDDLTDVFE